jgi:hypothetical protein
MIRFAACLSGFAFALLAPTCSDAALRYDWNALLWPQEAALPVLSPPPQQNMLDQLFLSQGIDPDSNKARIVRAWVDKIQRDPLIASAIPGGAQGIARLFLDPHAREIVMTNGLVRLPAADRLSYVRLMTKFLDELVPVDCFGLFDMGDVMARVSLREMSEADIEQYFELLSKVLVSDALDAPVLLPPRAQYASAERHLAHALLAQLGDDPYSVARFERYAANSSQATASDACWATRVTLHAILSMPDPDRDLILLLTILHAADEDATPARDPASPVRPSPASVHPGHAPRP